MRTTLLCGAVFAMLALAPSPATAQGNRISRYQLVPVGASHVFLVDTMTGQCWSRAISGDRWRDEGNPTRDRPERRGVRRPADDDEEVRLELPSESVELTIVQREERAIPGSDGAVRIRLGDITDGQALVSVTTPDETLIEQTSITQGDSLHFSVGNKEYVLGVRDLRNVLIGDDFATVVISEAERREVRNREAGAERQREHESPKREQREQRERETDREKAILQESE